MSAARFNTNPKVITTLLKAGAKIDDRDQGGMTPLMWAAKCTTTPAVITVLLKAGADVKVQSNEGKTALDYARENGKLVGTDAFKALEKASK
jgi:ankyrin repeat protein